MFNEVDIKPVKTVLFACVHNAGRSKMAAAFFDSFADLTKASAISAGSDPAQAVHPVVLEAMKEVGCDMTYDDPVLLTEEVAKGTDLFISMGCGEAGCPIVPAERIAWQIEDPKGKTLEEVRIIRDDIRERVLKLLTDQEWLSEKAKEAIEVKKRVQDSTKQLEAIKTSVERTLQAVDRRLDRAAMELVVVIEKDAIAQQFIERKPLPVMPREEWQKKQREMSLEDERVFEAIDKAAHEAGDLATAAWYETAIFGSCKVVFPADNRAPYIDRERWEKKTNDLLDPPPSTVVPENIKQLILRGYSISRGQTYYGDDLAGWIANSIMLWHNSQLEEEFRLAHIQFAAYNEQDRRKMVAQIIGAQ